MAYTVPDYAISIHALREEGDCSLVAFRDFVDISIHALREEGDQKQPCTGATTAAISIHALREEGDGTGLQAE